MIAGINWSSRRQCYFYGADHYVHGEKTDTEASHDLAHVLVACAGGLPWLPVGSDANVRLAEFNSVICEHLLSNAYNCTVLRSISEDRVLPATLIHARWFVEHHYAPFPMSARDACQTFGVGIDRAALTRLSPIYYLQRQKELSAGKDTVAYQIRFEVSDSPSTDSLGRAFQQLVLLLLEELHRSHAVSSHTDGNRSLAWNERIELAYLRTEHRRLQEELSRAKAEAMLWGDLRASRSGTSHKPSNQVS